MGRDKCGWCIGNLTITKPAVLVFFSSRSRHTRLQGDWSSDVCSSDLANPLTHALRELDLCGTHSGTKFIPEKYLHNSAEVRLGVLQGLLDTDGGPVLQEGRKIGRASCRERV